eukprot:jgi/Hompol1/5417/HPOL_004414-RA
MRSFGISDSGPAVSAANPPLSFSPDQYRLIVSATRSAASLGLLGVIGITYMFFLRPKMFANPVGRLVLALAAADFIDAVAKLLSRVGETSPGQIDSTIPACQIQAAFIQESTLASILITLAMTLTALYVCFFRGSISTLHKRAWVVVALCFGVSMPFAVLPIFMTTPDSHPFYAELEQPDLQFTFFYLEVLITFVISAGGLAMTWTKLRRLKAANPTGRLTKA